MILEFKLFGWPKFKIWNRGLVSLFRLEPEHCATTGSVDVSHDGFHCHRSE